MRIVVSEFLTLDGVMEAPEKWVCWLLRTSVQKTCRLHQPDFPFLSLSSGEWHRKSGNGEQISSLP